jgi:hypothetical protein
MFALLPLLAEVNQMWFSIPLIVAISLVYSATHHEDMRHILAHALRLGLMIVGFMIAIMIVLFLIGWQL